jgi:hypothetical protein
MDQKKKILNSEQPQKQNPKAYATVIMPITDDIHKIKEMFKGIKGYEDIKKESL